MAFTVADDHKAQEKVWAARPKWGFDPHDIGVGVAARFVQNCTLSDLRQERPPNIP